MRAGDRRLDDLDTIARMSGAAPSDEVPKLFSELETAGVFSREPDGTIFSRRMVRDTHLAQARSDAGAKGGSTTQQKLRDYSAEKEAAATVVAERRPPQSTAPALGELKSARAEGEASIKTFTQLHSDVREEALADVKHATSLAEINASVFAARPAASARRDRSEGRASRDGHRVTYAARVWLGGARHGTARRGTARQDKGSNRTRGFSQ
jgi:hypothetical protein